MTCTTRSSTAASTSQSTSRPLRPLRPVLGRLAPLLLEASPPLLLLLGFVFLGARRRLREREREDEAPRVAPVVEMEAVLALLGASVLRPVKRPLADGRGIGSGMAESIASADQSSLPRLIAHSAGPLSLTLRRTIAFRVLAPQALASSTLGWVVSFSSSCLVGLLAELRDRVADGPAATLPALRCRSSTSSRYS